MGTVSIRLETNNQFAAITRDLERQAPKRVFRKIARVIVPVYEHLLDRTLRQEPNERTIFSPSFVWSLDATKQQRARRWFFAHYPNGYRRTHQMARAWQTEIKFRDGALEFSIFNPTPGVSFVYGSDEYGQVPGHATTGWKRAADVLVDIGAETEDMVADLWAETIDEIVGA